MILSIAIVRPFYWFHVSPYCILWAVLELTIFFHSFIAFSWFHIKQQKARRKSFFLHFAQTRMKFIASNMRFHTEAFEKMPAELHIKRWQINSATLSSKTKTYLCDWRWWYTLVLMSFIIETSINYEAKTRTALRSTTADIDTFL